MSRDNHSGYDRNQTPDIPRPGKALLVGLVACGECGRELTVQYRFKTQYVCNSMWKGHRAQVCQRLPADPIDDHVVRLFLEALAPAKLGVFDPVRASLSEEREQIGRARRQQLERLRYQARLAECQYQKADPDNRLVAAELERRWEAALRELTQAEEAWEREQQEQSTPEGLAPETRRALTEARERMPQWWRANRFSQEQKKALLRSLIDEVIVYRTTPDIVHCRVVWIGGEPTDAELAAMVVPGHAYQAPGRWRRQSWNWYGKERPIKRSPGD
jgi:hypothetical protein